MTFMQGIVKQNFPMGVGERIKELREKRKMAGVHLAARAGINQSYLSKLERGKAGFSEEGLTKIARALGTNVSTLFGNGSLAPARVSNGLGVAVLTIEQAALPADMISNGKIEGFILAEADNVEDLFALYIRDQSNYPEFRIDDLVIIDRSASPRPGDMVIAVDGKGEAIFRRYRVIKSGSRGAVVFALVPMNEDYPTLRSDECPLSVRGVMVEHRKYRRR